MTRFARYLTVALLGTTSLAWALTSILAYKTFTREILTSSDLNSSFSRVITGVNDLIALHPGDSTVTVRGVFDTLDASPGPNLNVIRTVVFRDNQDSLVVPGRISADTVKVDDQLWIGMTSPVVGFSGGATAGTRLTFGSLVRADSVWIGTTVPVVGFTAGSTAGQRVHYAHMDNDTTRTDCLTVVGPATIKGTIQVTGGTLDVDGPATFALAPVFSGGLTTNQITATSKAVFSGASSVLMPAAIQMPSGTDGYVLTSDGRGRVALEAVSAGGTVVDTTSTIAIPFSAGTSALPALTRLGDLNTGIYFPAADQVGIAVNGVRALLVSGDDITVRDDINVGDDLLLPSTGVVNWGAGDVTVTGGTGTLTLAGASSGYQFNDGNVGIGDATTITLGLGIEKASADVGIRVERTTDAASVGQYYIDANGWVNIYAATTGKNIGLLTTGSGAVNVNSLGASLSVSTDASKNLTTASDSSWKQDRGEIVNATALLQGLKPRYWTWKKDANGLLTDSRRHDAWARSRAEAWTRVAGADSVTALSAVALQDRDALRAKVRKLPTLDDQPRLAGFFAQEVYSAFPEGSPGGANLDSTGSAHWGLNTTAIMALTVAAVQEQAVRIDSLEAAATDDSLRARIAVLEAAVADISFRLAKLEAR